MTLRKLMLGTVAALLLAISPAHAMTENEAHIADATTFVTLDQEFVRHHLAIRAKLTGQTLELVVPNDFNSKTELFAHSACQLIRNHMHQDEPTLRVTVYRVDGFYMTECRIVQQPPGSYVPLQ
jgi:hypothetical protein